MTKQHFNFSFKKYEKESGAKDQRVATLSRYLAIGIILVTVAPVTFFYTVLNRVASDTVQHTLEHELEEKAYLIRRAVDRYYDERKVELISLSHAGVLKGNNLEAIDQYIDNISGNSTNFIDIEIADMDARIITNSDFDDEAGNSLYEQYPDLKQEIAQFYQADQGDVFVSEFVILDDGTIGNILFTPIINDESGDVIKLLLVELSSATIRNTFSELDSALSYQHHDISIINEHGHALLSNRPDNLAYSILPELARNIEQLKNAQQLSAASYISGKHVIGISPLDASSVVSHLGLSVAVTAPYEDALSSITSLKKTSYALSILIGLFAFTIMLWASRRALQTVHLKANFDSVTALPNRRLFADRFTQAVTKAKRQTQECALLYIDLDHFKEVNDSFGHSAGDALLCAVSERLSSFIQNEDLMARLGGDEFAVVLQQNQDTAQVANIANQIVSSLTKPFDIEQRATYISASIGISIYPHDGSDVSELMKVADQALFHAKEQGRNRYSFFTDDMKQATQRRRKLAQDLRRAIEKDQLLLHLQPIINLSDTQHITKAEALLRWQHPELGFISPVEFIAIAEDSHIISELGDWVFTATLKAIKHAQKQYGHDIHVSVNVSPMQLTDVDLLTKWQHLLRTYSVDGTQIGIEITEGVLMSNLELVNQQLQQMKALGFSISLDDFGTGYSSLSYLKQISIDVVKIDKMFIDELEQNPQDLELCKAIVTMAHSLNMSVVAEGAETQGQVERLRSIAVDHCQGYYFSRPLALEDFYKHMLNEANQTKNES